MPATDVVSDANIALKWFHQDGEESVQAARELLDQHRDRRVVLHVLDLTVYEIGNALMRGHVRATAEQTATVISAVRQICLTIAPDDDDLTLATELVANYGLTLYDAAYAAVARRRDAPLATLDRQLLDIGLGITPDQLLKQLTQPGTFLDSESL
jgi:predicted nucleic acid-binding protein